MHSLKLVALVIVLVAIAAIGVANVVSFKSSDPSAAQDFRSMENRLNLIEQRLYTMQTSIQRLEQSASIQRSLNNDTGGREVNLLGEEVRNLRERLGEVECGVLKLDERTGTKRAKATDPCRANPTAPINLPARP